MRHLTSDQTADLKEIHNEDVELVSVTRPISSELSAAGEAILAARSDLDTRWIQSSQDADCAKRALSSVLADDAAAAIAEEIAAAVSALEALLGCSAVEVRMHSLHRPMCPRFHVDQVSCRLLLTLVGTGTEWVANGLERFACEIDKGVPESEIHVLPTGSWSLLKGGTWGKEFGGVLHRSPAGAGERLLFALDPQPPA